MRSIRSISRESEVPTYLPPTYRLPVSGCDVVILEMDMVINMSFIKLRDHGGTAIHQKAPSADLCHSFEVT